MGFQDGAKLAAVIFSLALVAAVATLAVRSPFALRHSRVSMHCHKAFHCTASRRFDVLPHHVSMYLHNSNKEVFLA